MDIIKTVGELADVLNEKNLSSVSVKTEDFEIAVMAKIDAFPSFPNFVPQFNQNESAAPQNPLNLEAVQASPKAGNFIKSPIVGTFYAAPAPDKPPFINVGDTVAKGQVVCIIESMKLMNEINSDFDGVIAEILVRDGEAVDFDKELIRII